jgi:hypothetical protein
MRVLTWWAYSHGPYPWAYAAAVKRLGLDAASDVPRTRSAAESAAAAGVGRCSFTPSGSPKIHPRFTPGSPQVHPRFTPGSPQVHPRFTPCTPQVHSMFTPGSPQVDTGLTPDSAQVQPSPLQVDTRLTPG